MCLKTLYLGDSTLSFQETEGNEIGFCTPLPPPTAMSATNIGRSFEYSF